jgi:WXG100 family type VII secretion target
VSTSSIDGTPLMVSDELAGAGTYINGSAQGIADLLAALIRQLTPMAESWSGPAASHFDPLMQQWNQAAIGLLGTEAQGGILGEIAAAMDVAWGNYSEAEWSNTSTWNPS